MSLVGCLAIKLLHLLETTTQSAVIFFTLFSIQFGIYAFYAIFIYPFFVSPLRHLPQIQGGLPLVGQGIELRRKGPGVMAKQWQVN